MTTITRARPEHAEQLTKIAIAAKRHWKYPEAWIQQWLPMLTLSAEYISAHETWLAWGGDEPAGYYSLTWENSDLWLDNLWVSPAQMGNGIGKALFQHALQRSRALGTSVLKIEADPNAQTFYEHMGAHKTGERRADMDGQPRILPLMEFNL